jgi:hypothetical protein
LVAPRLRGGAGWTARLNPYVIEATRSLCAAASAEYVDQEHRQNMAFYLTRGHLDFGVVPGALMASIPGYLSFHGIHALPSSRLLELRDDGSELARLWRETSARYDFHPLLLSARVGTLGYFRRVGGELRQGARIATSSWSGEGLTHAGLEPVATSSLGELLAVLRSGSVDVTDAVALPIAPQILAGLRDEDIAGRWEFVLDSEFFPASDYQVLFARARWNALPAERRDAFARTVATEGATLERIVAARDADERRALAERIPLVSEEPAVARAFASRAQARLNDALAQLRA